MDPYISNLLFHLSPLPQSTELLSQEVSSKEEGTDSDVLQLPMSTSHSNTVPIPNSSHSRLPQPSTSALTLSTGSDTNLVCHSTINKTSDRESMVSEMEPVFDLFSLISLPLSTCTELSQGLSHCLPVEPRVDMLQSPSSTTASDSVPPESRTSASQSSNCASLSSTYPSELEINKVPFENKQENKEVADEMDPFISNLLFHLSPLPQSTELLSREVSSKEKGTDVLQLPMSTSHSNTVPLPQPSTSAPTLSTYQSDPKVCTINKNSNRVVSEMEPVFDLFSLIPLPLSTELSQGLSHCFPVEPRVDMLQSPSSTTTASDNVPPESRTSALQSSNCASLSSTNPSEPEINKAPFENKQEDKEVADEMDLFISNLLFNMCPLPQSTDLLSQEEVSHSTSLQPSTTVSDSLPVILESSTSASQSLGSNCASANMPSDDVGLYNSDLFPLFLPPIPLPRSTDCSQGASQSASKEQRIDSLQPSPSTAPPNHLPSDQMINIQRKKSSPSPQCGHSSISENEDNTRVCMHIDPDPPCTPDESPVCRIQTTSPEQSMTKSFSPTPPLGFHYKKSSVGMSEISSPETPSQIEAETELSVKVQKCTNKKQKKKTISAIQQHRQRKLNKVSALKYRQRKKGEKSDLEVRREQLEVANVRLKEQISFLTNEITKLKKLSQKTRKSKCCPFFLRSTCSKFV